MGALAPICLTIQVPTKTGGVAHWLMMRKIEIAYEGSENPKSKKLDYNGKHFSMLDLKGPKFTGLRDGKSWFSRHAGDQKDLGFTHMFKDGLDLKGCGSSSGAYVLQLDSNLLATESMTDYSLFAQTYELPSESDYKCACGEKPKFPLILDVQAPTPMRMAVGVIDYIERGVSSFDKVFGTSLSTMRPPAEYKDWWMLMWPAYFHLPHRTIEPMSGEKGHPCWSDYQPEEIWNYGDHVVVLERIKWQGGSSDQEDIIVSFKGFVHMTVYFNQTQKSGSKYKVQAGSVGTILSITDIVPKNARWPVALLVEFDDIPEIVFRVRPEQVMKVGSS